MRRLHGLMGALVFLAVAASSAAAATAKAADPPPVAGAGVQPVPGLIGGPDAFGYVFIDSNEPGGPTYSWIDISASGTPTGLGCDDCYSGPYPIGFEFPFYGVARTQWYLGSNGYLTFGSGDSSLGNPCPLGQVSPGWGYISLMWDDLYPGGPVYQTFESCPVGVGRCLVVEFTSAWHYGGGFAGVFEAILYESGLIVLQFQNAGGEAGGGSTTGIAGEAGALTYACNAWGSLTGGLAILFSPSPVFLLADRTVRNVCPDGSAEYVFRLFNNTGETREFNIACDADAGTMSCPAVVGPVVDGDIARFTVTHTLPAGLEEFDSDTGSVTATEVQSSLRGRQSEEGPATWTTNLTTTARSFFGNRLEDPPRAFRHAGTVYDNSRMWVFGGAGADDLPGATAVYDPEFGWFALATEMTPQNYVGDMAFGSANTLTSGAWLAAALAYPGLGVNYHVYDPAGDAWQNPAGPSGVPQGGLAFYDVACREQQTGVELVGGPCYVTGGRDYAEVTQNTAFAWDVDGNVMTPLPPFTTPRMAHVSFLLAPDPSLRRRDAGATQVDSTLLCVAGGWDGSRILDSTQCYDFTAGAWHAENADLPPLPAAVVHAADGVLVVDGVQVPLIVGGQAATDVDLRAPGRSENTWFALPEAWALWDGAWYVAPDAITPMYAVGGYPDANTLHLVGGYGADGSDIARYEAVTICSSAAFWMDLKIEKEASADVVLAGQSVTFYTTVTNLSSLSATNLVSQTPLPEGTVFIDGGVSQGDCTVTGDMITCQLGRLGPGAQATGWMEVIPGGMVTTYTSTTSLACDQPDRDPEDNVASATVTILRPAAVELWVDHRPDGFTVSNANGVLEPGETVLAAPTWRNPTGQPFGFTGQADTFTGPAALGYFIGDNTAGYGQIPAGGESNCDSATGDLYRVWVPVPLVRPAMHWDATLREVLYGAQPDDPIRAGRTEQEQVAAAVREWPVHIGQSFTDVPVGSIFYKYVEMLLHSGVTLGCGGAFYCPDQTVTRWMMAMFLARAMAGSDEAIPDAGTVPGRGDFSCTPGGRSIFVDVFNSDMYCRHVHYIAAAGVTLGCGGPMYCPASLVTRDQMAMFVARAMAGGDGNVPMAYADPGTGRAYDCNGAGILPNGAGSHFADVATAASYCRHANYIWARGVVDGCSLAPPLYCPTDNVTREQMAKFLVNGFGLGPVLP